MCSRAIGCQLLSQSRYLRIPYCHAVTKPERMRLNIGFHILAGECGPSPCGFCGKSYQCSVGLKATKKAKAPTSDGPYFAKFSLKSAELFQTKLLVLTDLSSALLVQTRRSWPGATVWPNTGLTCILDVPLQRISKSLPPRRMQCCVKGERHKRLPNTNNCQGHSICMHSVIITYNWPVLSYACYCRMHA